ncbi:epoxide hydrolase family protein [Leifsonia flava]|uniref:Epoxide hydrolase n=1 Tax=Orlajensenia leifsoniae TaxID=2561933 RepID=A0A4Y9R4C1_9MICO|nr:epoxide hydrolase family protein [Leifsonia flava]TFV98802.1 epoxide hydrolase [Leifsonia flava]
MTSTAFMIAVPDDTLDDLRMRLRNTRFTTPSRAEFWGAGVDPGYLASLVAGWADWLDSDWRSVESRLNALDHRLIDVDGTSIHIVRATSGPVDGERMPLLLMHGWPSSFVEMLALVEEFQAAGAPFEIVVPSMPGFLFSELPEGPLTREAMADVMHALMTEELGFERYGVFGGDIGGTVAAWLAAKHPESVTGLYMIHPPFPAEFEAPLTDAEHEFLESEAEFDQSDGGYSAIMITRPDTIGAAVADSPAGLLAWIIDKYRDWSDCGGDLETRFDRETLFTIGTLYWATESIGTSFRQYVDYDANRPRPDITVPAGFTVSAEPGIREMPRSIADRSCSDIRVWHEPSVGGHFLAHEEPKLLGGHLTAFFASI